MAMGEEEQRLAQFRVIRLAFAADGGEFVDVGLDGGPPPERAELIELVPGLAVPRSVLATVTREDWPVEVSVVISNGEHEGRVLSVQVLAREGGSVTTLNMRAVPVDSIVRWVQTIALAVCVTTVPAIDAATLSSEERLERAAGLYRLAMVLHEDPTAFVAGSLKVSRSTAGRLIRECRGDRGLLGPALGTVAGELREGS